jgi:DNA-binding transcriptional LysR family regulator
MTEIGGVNRPPAAPRLSDGNRPPAAPLLEVRELRYFRAVAEELSFSAAARRLGIAQPPLSRAISKLERQLGVRLLNRDHHHVELTAAGATLLEEARDVLDAVSAAAHRTRQAAQTSPRLVITAKPGAASLLPRLVEAYRAGAGSQPEAAEVEVLVSGHGQQVDLVRTGRADAALIGPPHRHPGLDAEPLLAEPRVAALPAGHPLTKRDSLRCIDLVGYPIPQRPNAGPEAREYWTGRDRITPADGAPASPPGPMVQDHSQLLEVVALGQAVALIPESLAAQSQRPEIVYRPVTDASPYTIALVWPARVRNRWLAEFVRTAMEYAASRGGVLFEELAAAQ